MLPTISSSSSSSRRQGSRNRPKASRSKSSALLGAIKNIVTAPLSWFNNTDDFEQNPDPQGKRRRIADSNKESIHEDTQVSDAVEEGIAPRVKRMRVHSPDRQAYLDPPQAAFARNMASPSRNPMQRTMSIDPQSTPRGMSMSALPELSPGPFSFRTVSRDLSLPPASPSRIGFRSRTTVTPQPPSDLRRDVSEPPPITSLMQHPAFVRPPQPEQPRQDAITLGHLADYQRDSRSPSRSHSLLFPQHPAQSAYATTSRLPPIRAQTPVQKAIHELDIYKTPLIPSRLRATTPSLRAYDINSIVSQDANSGAPDLFKKRHPILMNDRQRRTSGSKRKGRDDDNEGKRKNVNETKPYAGEGGMKKLLARRKAEDEAMAKSRRKGFRDESEDEDVSDEDDRMDGELSSKKQSRLKRVAEVDEEHAEEIKVTTTAVPDIPPLPPKQPTDWYAAASKASGPSALGGSSLRVGRTKASRNHIARPSAPAARRPNRFSAAFEDVDDSIGEEVEESERKRQEEFAELESASKKAPVFNIPAGFSFAQEAPPLTQSDSRAADPPIVALPFSFGKPSAAEATPKAPEPEASTSAGAAPVSLTAKPPAAPVSAFQFPAAAAAPLVKPAELPTTQKPAESAPGSGVPNFFAKSSMFSQPTPPPASALPPTGFNLGPSPAPSAPGTPKVAALEPAQNPFAISAPEPPKTADLGASPGLFGSTTKVVEASAAPSTFGGFNFGQDNSSSAPQEQNKEAAAPAPSSSSQAPSPFSFGSTTSAPSAFASSSAAPSSTSPFSFGKPANETAPAAPAIAEQLSVPSNPAKEASPVPFSFGNSASATPPNPVTETKPESSPVFTFKQPAASSAPKPLFGTSDSASIFSSGNKMEAAQTQNAPPAPASTPFSFGSAPATPPAVEKKPAFSFGAPAVASPSTASTGFSFGGGGSAASDVSNKPPGLGFGFGAPVSLAPSARPSTPPKPAQEDEGMRMEESPTRDLQVPASGTTNQPRPTLGTGAGSFPFGSMNNGPTPSNSFSFGAPQTTSSTLFGGSQPPAAAPEAPKSSFSFGTPAQTPSTASPSSPFSFGQAKAPEPPRPSTTGGFSFGSAPSSAAPTSASPFSFGAPAPAAANPFGAPSASAPGSPSTFNQSTPFSFGGVAPAPTPAASQSFSFGSSQPASPATGSTNLPQTSGGFGSNAGTPAPAFGGGASAPSGQSLFTIGAAPAPAPGQRQIKKLPRRPGAKR
ncbi:hypothetical protein HGRIS_013428 [Hohenbuehelia grisea]|uniref:Uncharacterized protein n=1 Tax=Hohenbuehelia grisea TaxID=104357 RepID=A0ABR3IVM4_9AGAR